MQLTLVENKNKPGHWKLITKSTRKHPALLKLAEILKESNKQSDFKLGIFSVPDTKFSTHQKVFSYIANRYEHMSRNKYYSWLKGACSLKSRRSRSTIWKEADSEPEIDEIIDVDSLFYSE